MASMSASHVIQGLMLGQDKTLRLVLLEPVNQCDHQRRLVPQEVHCLSVDPVIALGTQLNVKVEEQLAENQAYFSVSEPSK